MTSIPTVPGRRREPLPRRTRACLGVGGVVLLLLAAGCGLPTTSGADPSSEPTEISTSGSDPGTHTPAPTEPDQSGSPTSGATPAGGPAGAQPVATRPGSIDAVKVTATLYPVRRTGDASTVSLYLAADDPTATFMLLDSLGDGNSETSSKSLTSVDGIRLVDPVARKAYLPAVTADGQCVCSPDDGGAATEARTTVWVSVTFANPPTALSTINVTVPVFGTFTDVPLH